MPEYFLLLSGSPRKFTNNAQRQKLPGYSRFYFVCGDAESDEMVSGMQKMADIVRAAGKDENKRQ